MNSLGLRDTFIPLFSASGETDNLIFCIGRSLNVEAGIDHAEDITESGDRGRYAE